MPENCFVRAVECDNTEQLTGVTINSEELN